LGWPMTAAAPRRMTVPALLGAALGYLLMAAPPAAWQYPLAALLAVGLRQLLAVITHKARPWQNVIGGTYWFGHGSHPARSIPPPTGV